MEHVAEVFLLLLVIVIVFVATRLGVLGDALGGAIASLVGTADKDESPPED